MKREERECNLSKKSLFTENTKNESHGIQPGQWHLRTIE